MIELISNVELRASWDWPYFTPGELECRCDRLPRVSRYATCPTLIVNPRHVDLLVALRRKFARPMRISSGFRCPQHNDNVSSTGKNGPHTWWAKGYMAVDVAVYGEQALDLIVLARTFDLDGLEVTGIGVAQRGRPQSSRFIHLDTLPVGGSDHPRPWIWSY